MTVVFVIGLIFMVLDLDEIGVDGGGVEGERDEGVDGGGFGNDGEGPGLWGCGGLAFSSWGREGRKEGHREQRTCAFRNWINPGSSFTI